MSFWWAAALAAGLWFRQVAAQDGQDMIMQEVKYIWPTPTWRIPLTTPTRSGKTLLDRKFVSRLADIGQKAFDKYVRDVLPVELKADPKWAKEFAESDHSRINEAFLRWQKRVFAQKRRAPLIDLSWDGSPIPKYKNVSYDFPELYEAKEFKALSEVLDRMNSMFMNYLDDPSGNKGHQHRFRTFIWIEVFRYADAYKPHVHTGACSGGMFFARYEESKDGAQKFSFEDSRGINPPFGKTHNVDISQGDLLLFPSWASHFITPHRSNSTNVFFSFVSWPPQGADGLDWEDDPAGDFVLRKALRIKKPKTKQYEVIAPPKPDKQGFTKHSSYISEGGDLLQGKMTLKEAKQKALETDNCKGFTFKGEDTGGPLHIYFKDKFDNQNSNKAWTSYQVPERKDKASHKTEL